MHWVLQRPGIFLNSSSDATLLKVILDAASTFDPAETAGLDEDMVRAAGELQLEPLFERGVQDDVR